MASRGFQRSVADVGRWWAWSLVLLAAAGLRGIYWHAIRDTPGYLAPQNDPQAYLQTASNLVHGSAWGDPEPFFKAPFYSYLLAAIERLGAEPVLATRPIQFAVGIATALLAGALAGVIASKSLDVRPRSAGLLAAAVAGLHGVFVYFEGEILITSWVVFLDLAGLLLLVRRPSVGGRAAAGLVFGLSAIARPTVLVYAGVLLVGLVLEHRRRWGPVLAFGLGLCLPILPVTVRNVWVGGDFVLISHQGGIAFYTGNNPASEGRFGSPAGFEIVGGNWEYYDCVRYAEAAEGHALRPSEVSRFFSSEGLRFWRENPGDALRLLGRKTRLYFGRMRVSNNQNIDYALSRSVDGAPWAPLFWPSLDAWLFAAGIAGLGLLGRRSWPLVLFVVVYSATVIAFFVSARYRVPVLAALVPAAAVFGCAWCAHWRRPPRRLLGASALGVGVLLFSWPDPYQLGTAAPVQARFAEASSLQRLGRTDEARAGYHAVLEARPGYPRAWLNLGALALAAGDTAKADAAFSKEIALHPGEELAHNNLGAIALGRGELDVAVRAFERAVQLRPNYIRAWRNLASALHQSGRSPAALEALDRALEVGTVRVEYRVDQAGTRSDRAAILAHLGESELALAEYRRSLELNPVRIEPRVGLGSVLGRTGRLGEARRVLEGVVAEEPEHFEANLDLGNVLRAQGDRRGATGAYERARRARPGRPEPCFSLGTLAWEAGHRDEAARHFRRALAADSGFLPARSALAALGSEWRPGAPSR